MLKEIASSDVARYSGTKLEQDLPDNHLWAKSLNDPQRYLHTSHGLRVAKILSDLQGLRSLIGNLSLGKLSEALRTVVDTQQGHLAALSAAGTELSEAVNESLSYLDHCLEGGFQPGMGQVLPDRLFWARMDDDEDDDESDATSSFEIAPNDTRH